jgi:hypothetical protein
MLKFSAKIKCEAKTSDIDLGFVDSKLFFISSDEKVFVVSTDTMFGTTNVGRHISSMSPPVFYVILPAELSLLNLTPFLYPLCAKTMSEA